ncbi:hypothetical protein [Psychrobacillus sp. FSL H8-0487]|uniref:hypothetical protein n=1 Tax=Psychrobacillus sp. FSL H8-0487 TaxID=2921391 RepID=UPI0030F5622C
MGGFFKNNNYKVIDNYFEIIVSGAKAYLSSEVKMEYSEELIWFLTPTPVLGVKLDNLLPATAYQLNGLFVDVPDKLAKDLKKAMFKRYEHSEEILENYSIWLEKKITSFISEKPNYSSKELLEFVSSNLGRYLCFHLETFYKEDGQQFKFSIEFADEVGRMLIGMYQVGADLLK